MSSQIANQTRTVPISWACTTNDTTTFNTPIIIPFLVDEIRVVASGSQLLSLADAGTGVDEFGASFRISSDSLVGSSGGVLAAIRNSYRNDFDADSTVSGITTDYNQNIRYVFPPSAKRNINGSYVFQATHLDGSKLDMGNHNDVTIFLVLEFIQYKEVEKQMLDTEDDLRLLGKSGRRRL